MNIRPIRTDKDHAAALRRMEEIFGAAPDSPDEEELDVLATLVDAYEEKRWPIEVSDPIEAINLRMEQKGHTQADLAEVIGSRSRASEILKRKRGLTIDMIRAISLQWKIPAESLLGPYAVKARPTLKDPQTADRAATTRKTKTRAHGRR
jgi:HTH-type transcriptional regulator/antitoxin HigA